VRPISANMSEQGHALESAQPFLWMVEIEVLKTTGAERYRLCANPVPVVFGTNTDGDDITYEPFPFGLSEFETDSEGGLPQTTIAVGNVTLEMVQVLHDNEAFTGRPALIRLVQTLDLDDPSAGLEFNATIIGCRVNEESIAFSVAAANLYERFLPMHRYQALRCRNKYGGDRCAFPTNNPAVDPSLLPDCAKTLEACELRGAEADSLGLVVLWPRNFGAERGLYKGPAA